MLQALFPTPIFIHDFVGEQFYNIQNEITNKMPEIVSFKNKDTNAGKISSTFRFSEDSHVNDIQAFSLNIVNQSIMEKVHEYAYSINYKGNFLRLQGSWFNFFEKDNFYYDHTHPGVKVAGVYYYKTTGLDGKIRFTNPNPHMYFGNWPADGMEEESVKYLPKEGRLMLWPAWLVHRVEPNSTNTERISLGINFD